MDIEKTIQFILEQQARHETNLQQTDELLRKVANIQIQQAGMQLQQGEILLRHDAQIGELIQSQRRTDETVRALAEQGRHTDERLNALIKVVDDLIRRDGSRPY